MVFLKYRLRRLGFAIAIGGWFFLHSDLLWGEEGPGILIHDRKNFGNDLARADRFEKIAIHPKNAWITKRDGTRESFYQIEIQKIFYTPNLRDNFLTVADFEKLRKLKRELLEAINTYPRTKATIEPLLREVGGYLQKGDQGYVFYQGTWKDPDEIEEIAFTHAPGDEDGLPVSASAKPSSLLDRWTPLRTWQTQLDEVPRDFLAAYLQASEKLIKKNATAIYHYEKENGRAEESEPLKIEAPPTDRVAAYIRGLLRQWEQKSFHDFGGQIVSKGGKNCTAKEADQLFWDGVNQLWNGN